MSFLTGNALGSCGCGGCSGGVAGIQVIVASAPWTGWGPMDTVAEGAVSDWSTDWPDFYVTAFNQTKYLKRTIYIELGDSYNGNFWIKRVTTIARNSNTFIDEYTTNYAGDPGSHPQVVNQTIYGFTGQMPWWAQTGPDWAGYMPPSGYENTDTVRVVVSKPTYFEAVATQPATPSGVYLLKITVQMEDANWWYQAEQLASLGLLEYNLLDPATVYDHDYLNTATGEWENQGTFRFGYGYQMGVTPALYTRVGAFLTPQWASGDTPTTAPPIGAYWLLCPCGGADFVAANLVAAKGSFLSQPLSGGVGGGVVLYTGYSYTPADIWEGSWHLGYITMAMGAVKITGQLGERAIMDFDKTNLQYVGTSGGIDARGAGEYIFNPGDCADFQELYISTVAAGTYPPPTLSSSQSTLSSSSEISSK